MRKEIRGLADFIIGTKDFYTLDRIRIALDSVDCSLYYNNSNGLVFLDNVTSQCITLGVEKKMCRGEEVYKIKYARIG